MEPTTPPEGRHEDPFPTPFPSGRVYKDGESSPLLRPGPDAGNGRGGADKDGRYGHRKSGSQSSVSEYDLPTTPTSSNLDPHAGGRIRASDIQRLPPPPPQPSGGGRAGEAEVPLHQMELVDGEIVGKLLALDETRLSDLSAEFTSTTLALALKTLRRVHGSLQQHKEKLSRLELKNQLLTLQAHESAQRYEVENSIVKREVERLRLDQQRRQQDDATAAETYRRRLCKAKIRLRDAEKELVERDLEIDKLKRRLREGRAKRDSLAEQAQQYANANAHQTNANATGLETLGMLASQVLSQNNSAAASPNPNVATSPVGAPKRLMSPLTFVSKPDLPTTEKRRRHSSASTITIPSDDDTDDRHAPYDDPNATVEEEEEEEDEDNREPVSPRSKEPTIAKLKTPQSSPKKISKTTT
ncbi:hypothetical protein TRICI_006159 [Trichomonascus ciferrii]|uniref:Uncharacterized protein n=1 Tax=Trichomonascus ciferrii TaxID=44093 RepID=A0A642UKN9_9ASCO|nr:hypothetical protein TRICI_006159 [Trichomonascus ciferrii]